MAYKFFLVLGCLLFSFISDAQQLPQNECGIVCTYDAAGNRLRRIYFCNFGGTVYPTGRQKQETGFTEEKQTEEYQAVDALYPNPTTGRFFINFSRELRNARVMLTDINGKVVQQSTGNGFKLSFDLSPFASGVYMVRVEEGGNVLTKKVIKQ